MIIARLSIATVVLVAALLAVGRAAPEPGQSSNKEFKVDLYDDTPYFNPKRIRVPNGTTVTWENHGPGLTHTIVFVGENGTVHSGPLRPKQIWSHTFAGDTVIKISCEIHPYMYGMVVVGDPPGDMIKAVETELQRPTVGQASARIIEFPLPIPNSVPGILAVDGEDNVWLTLGGGGWGNINFPPLDKFARLTIDGDISIFSTPTPDSGPSGLLIDPDGTIFITELMAGKIARFSPRQKTIEEFTVPTTPSWPTGLAVERDGSLWFNETKGNKVGKLLRDGTIVEYPVPTDGANPTGMVIDARGAVWIAERDAGKVASITKSGLFVELSLSTPNAKPAGMALDSRGRVWVAERSGNKLAVIEGGVVREYPLPNPNSAPFFVVPDVDDNIWFSEVFGNRIGVLVQKTGDIVEFGLPTKDAWPGGLAFDQQGNLWFTEQLGNKVGVLTNAAGALADAVGRRRLEADASGDSPDASHRAHESKQGERQ
jgi:virginiamycin B lyase